MSIIELQGLTIEYRLTRKNVKNINLRIKSDGVIYISANKSVPVEFIRELLQEKSDYILKALKKIELQRKQISFPQMSEEELVQLITNYSHEIYPYYKKKVAIDFPIIKFRKMKSRWGSCCPPREILTFNKKLVFASKECIRYVIHHEFTHFIHPNHSMLFYNELAIVCPEWKKLRKELNNIIIS